MERYRYGTVPAYLTIGYLATEVSLILVWYTGTVQSCKFYQYHINADPDANPDPDY